MLNMIVVRSVMLVIIYLLRKFSASWDIHVVSACISTAVNVIWVEIALLRQLDLQRAELS